MNDQIQVRNFASQVAAPGRIRSKSPNLGKHSFRFHAISAEHGRFRARFGRIRINFGPIRVLDSQIVLEPTHWGPSEEATLCIHEAFPMTRELALRGGRRACIDINKTMCCSCGRHTSRPVDACAIHTSRSALVCDCLFSVHAALLAPRGFAGQALAAHEFLGA